MGIRALELGDVGRAVAHNVKTLREAGGLTQTDVSDRMNAIGRPLLRTGVVRIEQGSRRVDVDDLVALAWVFDVPPDELLGPLAEGDRTYGRSSPLPTQRPLRWSSAMAAPA